MLKTLNSYLLMFFLTLLLGCSPASKMESTGQYIDSSGITVKVKANLVDQLGTQSFGIKVITYKDEVQLSGFVDNAMIKRRAGNIAANTIDVKSVRNDLIVK